MGERLADTIMRNEREAVARRRAAEARHAEEQRRQMQEQEATGG